MILGDYGAVLFDWGDTVMWDDPIQSLPMVAWPQVEPVAGVDVLLGYLCAGFRIAPDR